MRSRTCSICNAWLVIVFSLALASCIEDPQELGFEPGGDLDSGLDASHDMDTTEDTSSQVDAQGADADAGDGRDTASPQDTAVDTGSSDAQIEPDTSVPDDVSDDTGPCVPDEVLDVCAQVQGVCTLEVVDSCGESRRVTCVECDVDSTCDAGMCLKRCDSLIPNAGRHDFAPFTDPIHADAPFGMRFTRDPAVPVVMRHIGLEVYDRRNGDCMGAHELGCGNINTAHVFHPGLPEGPYCAFFRTQSSVGGQEIVVYHSYGEIVVGSAPQDPHTCASVIDDMPVDMPFACGTLKSDPPEVCGNARSCGEP